MNRCPYCGSDMQTDNMLPSMNKKKQKVYQIVCSAGAPGIDSESIIMKLYDPNYIPVSAHGMLRVLICEINKIIGRNGQRITGIPRGAYRLVSTKGAYDGKAVKEDETKSDNLGSDQDSRSQ